MTQLLRGESLADQAYQALREGIATGVISPGERVTERGLADRLAVSPTPIREAMRRLEQDGLIEKIGPRHVRVIEHSPETLREFTYIWAHLRAMEARFATAKISDEALSRMEAIVNQLSVETESSSERILDLAGHFDEEIERAADNATLRNMIRAVSIFGHSRRIGLLDVLRSNPREAMQRLQDHKDILAALRARDADLVESFVLRNTISGAERLYKLSV